MRLKIKRIFYLFILILLQSCSGGRIGNFLDSSFKNIEEPKIKKDSINSEKNKVVLNSGVNVEKNKNIEDEVVKVKIKNNLKNQKTKKSVEKSEITKKIKEQNVSLQKKQYQPQTYKIIFILKNVDPKDPTEDLRTILRNSDVNFEIEKIERYFDPKNKSIKTN